MKVLQKEGIALESRLLTWRTIAALMHPLIGGIVVEHSERSFDRDSGDETSQVGVNMLTPPALSFSTVSKAAGDSTSNREGRIRCLTPFPSIQRLIARLIPPSPPTIRYAAFSSNFQVWRVTSRVCESC